MNQEVTGLGSKDAELFHFRNDLWHTRKLNTKQLEALFLSGCANVRPGGRLAQGHPANFFGNVDGTVLEAFALPASVVIGDFAGMSRASELIKYLRMASQNLGVLNTRADQM